MIRTSDLKPSLLISFGAAAAGAVVLAFIVAPPPLPLPVAEAATADIVPTVQPVRVRIRSASNYDIISERPLFNKGRAKDVAPPPTAAQKPQLPPLSNYRLVGLVVSNDTQRALIARSTGEILNLGPGDTLDGRSVAKIAAGGVTFTADMREETLAFPRIRRIHEHDADAGPAGSTQANQ